ncbi:MAG: FkbM family methyltransferase [Verrucomicrobiaceae bacterium]|nr:FkbM family methyltransferase [Verrucomicrobiaceae bacterium]
MSPATPSDPLFVLPNGLSIHQVSAQETAFLYKEIFVERAYFKHGITLEGSPCVIDIGANIGMFSLCVKHTCPDARVLALEPSPRLHGLLTRNLLPFGDSARALACGVAERDGEAVFTYYPDYSIMSGFHADAARDAGVLAAGIRQELHSRAGTGRQVPESLIESLARQRLGGKQELLCPLRSLSSLIREWDLACVDLLKVDAERSELAVLRGIEPQDWPKIRQIVIEVHDAATLHAVEELLREKGFRFVAEQEQALAQSGVFNGFATR